MQLKPVLGPVQLVFYSVGVIIGAGVYSVIGAAAGIAHESIWLSFVMGALVALLTGLSYAEMTTAFPHGGRGIYLLAARLPRSGLGRVFGRNRDFDGRGRHRATVAVAFGGYLRVFVDVPVLRFGCFLLCFARRSIFWEWRNRVGSTLS